MDEENIRNTFATNLNRLMKEKGATQAELAKFMGVSTATTNNWVKGKKIPRMDKVDKLCDFFLVERSALLSCDTPATPPPMQLSPADIVPSFHGLLFIIRKYTASLADTEKSAIDTALDMIEHCLQRIESVLSKVKA